MFDIEYRIVNIGDNDSENFEGSEGYFVLICNGNKYGEIFPAELDSIMGTVSIYWYFIYLLEIIENIQSEKKAYLSDIDSYNTWIEFRLIGEDVIIGVGTGEKEDGSKAIEYKKPSNFSYSRWENQAVKYEKFKMIVLQKATNYLDEITKLNTSELTNPEINKLKNQIAYISN